MSITSTKTTKTKEIFSRDFCRYETVENSSGIKDIMPPKSWTFEDVQDWLSEHSAAVNDGRPLDPNIDLFEQGFDRCVRSLTV